MSKGIKTIIKTENILIKPRLKTKVYQLLVNHSVN